MKILAIRGKNLASLARQFEVNFATEPLASTGIFAITGPTGAGKSTLLDALCLALYDDMPRLPREGYRGQNLPDVSGETIAPRDARNILRRGAAEAFAEVDFIGNDGVSYRAHWSVRRARIKSEGRLQNSEMSLLRLDSEQPLAGARKTEVLHSIAERIGLSFEQFTRAVLLAQNEFSAFLKASDDKRAELLQTLTGTDLFADLSRRAYQRAKTAEQSLTSLRERLTALQVLSTEERQHKQLASSQAQLQVQVLETERSQLEQQLQWYQQTEQLQQAANAAESVLAEARDQEQAASQRQTFLTQVEAVQSARSPVENLGRISQDLVKAQANLQAATTESEHSEQTLRTAQQALSTAKQQLEDQQAAYQTLQPVLLQARELDTIIQTLQPRYVEACKEQQAAQDLVQRLQAQQVAQASDLERLAQQQTQVTAWLAAHAQWQALAEHWAHWQGMLQQAKSVLHKQQSGESELVEVQHKIEQTQNALNQTEFRLKAHKQSLVEVEDVFYKAKTQAAQYDLDQLAKQRQRFEQQRTHLQSAEQAWQSLESSQQAVLQANADLQQLQTQQAQCEQALTIFRLELPLIERDAERAEHAWRLAQAACADQAALWRSQLQAGDACPVCGSTEHPYAHQQPVLDAVLNRLQQNYEQQRQALKALEAQVATEQARLQQYQQQQRHLAKSLATAQAANAQATTTWQTYASLVSAAENLPAELAATQVAIAAVQQAEQTARYAYQQLELDQQTWQQAQQQLSTTQELFKACETELQQLQTKQHYLQQTQSDFKAQLATSLKQLNAAFEQDDWQEAWQHAPDDFERDCQQQVQAWQAQQQRTQALAEQQTALVVLQTQSSFAWQQAQHDLARLLQQTAQLKADLETQQTQRANLLAGQSIAAFEASWALKLEQLAAHFATAQLTLEQTAKVQVRSSEALKQLQALIEEYEAQQLNTRQTLLTSLDAFKQAGFELTEAELYALLAYTPAWLQSERSALQVLHTATHRAQAVVAERQAQLRQHASLRTATHTFEEVQLAQTQNAFALQSAQQAWQELLLALREDEQRREQASSLQAELAHLSSQARVWGQLNELIGSADGKKFRNFAQQYSLDVLLSYANRHLADLSRRYTLRRVRESLALLVLDLDMGGEIRSVHSLSGGESFLVSLALALGLASLSSQRVKVESLFIDEGFGSLDADSLRVAMDALDQLQAQGRKVGVISHVQEMTERIAVQIQVKRLSGGQSYIKVSAH